MQQLQTINTLIDLLLALHATQGLARKKKYTHSPTSSHQRVAESQNFTDNTVFYNSDGGKTAIFQLAFHREINFACFS